MLWDQDDVGMDHCQGYPSGLSNSIAVALMSGRNPNVWRDLSKHLDTEFSRELVMFFTYMLVILWMDLQTVIYVINDADNIGQRTLNRLA